MIGVKWKAEYIRERFGFEIEEKSIDRINNLWNARPSWAKYECMDCALIWLKNRLNEIPKRNVEPPSVPLSDITLPVLMHVWFLFIYETGEMICKLRCDTEKISDEPARSKISKTVQFISPIDQVAGRVL